MKDAHEDTEQGVVKEDVGEKISASGRGYTLTWQQDLLRALANSAIHPSEVGK